MVNCVFGFSPGSISFVFDSLDPLVKAHVKSISAKYLVHGQISMKKLVKCLLDDNTKVGFMRSFVLFMIGIILCPCTYDSLSPKFLFSLLNVDDIPNLDYGSLCIKHLRVEIENRLDKVFGSDDMEVYNQTLYIGGYLPLVAVSLPLFFVLLFLTLLPFLGDFFCN
jgi:hypothetical protein